MAVKIIDDTNLGYLFSKVKAAFWPKTDVEEVGEISIDSTPTSGSSNLVTSGGVYSAIPTVPTNVSSFTNDANYAKYYLCTDETEYTSIQNKDSGTLYLIPESSS